MGILEDLIANQGEIMATLAQIASAVADLQATLDAEQQQIADAIAGLTTQIANLEAMLTDGGTEAERQAVLDALASIKTDLEGTIPEEPVAPSSAIAIAESAIGEEPTGE